MADLTVIWWRDIPAQVTATDGTRTVRQALPDRFQQAIDAAAMRAGLIDSDAYLDAWHSETRSCGDELTAEVAAETERLDAAFDHATVSALVRAGGEHPG